MLLATIDQAPCVYLILSDMVWSVMTRMSKTRGMFWLYDLFFSQSLLLNQTKILLCLAIWQFTATTALLDTLKG